MHISSGWSTIAPPMLAFLYCFAQIGLEWTSHPPWVTLTLCRSENPCYRTPGTTSGLQRLALTSRSLRGQPGFGPPNVSEAVAEAQLFSSTCRTKPNLSASWTSRRKFFLYFPGTKRRTGAFHFIAVLSMRHQMVFILRNCKRKCGPWVCLARIILITNCSVVR